MAKADKLVGGNKVKPASVFWNVTVTKYDTGGLRVGEVTLSGTATDPIQAAAEASRAQQSILDASNADSALAAAAAGAGEDEPTPGSGEEDAASGRRGRSR